MNDDDTGVKYTGSWTRNGGKELVQDAQDLNVMIMESSDATNPIAPEVSNLVESLEQAAPESVVETGEHWVIYIDAANNANQSDEPAFASIWTVNAA